MIEPLNRRAFLAKGMTGFTAAWASAHWPALLAAAQHAHHAAQSPAPVKFEFFTPEQAVEIDAITARIIPTDETPGAHEAGVVYFIDRALTTFAKDAQKTYHEALHSLDEGGATSRRGFRSRPGAQNFFETLRQHTIMGFLIDPDYGGNHEGAGWKVIGREREHTFQPPFGYYDKDYRGWDAEAKEAEKK
jgi:Gluconate 2-dehydrogenase subunit 3